MSGYYSIVQFMPKPERHEGVNFGIMLLDRESGKFDAVLTYPVRRVNAMFSGVSEAVMEDLAVAFHNRIGRQEIRNLDDMTAFVLSRGGIVQCTEPEWIEIPPNRFYATLEELLSLLVR